MSRCTKLENTSLSARDWFALGSILPRQVLYTKSTYRAKLTAYVTTYAESVVDGCLAILHRDGWTSDLHAALTANALTSVNVQRWIVLDIFKKRTGTS